MPLDPLRLARVRAHLLTATALVAVGCGSSGPDHTINEPIHINRPPDPPSTASPEVAVPTAEPTSNPSAQAVAADPPATATPGPKQPYHINRPARSKP